MRLPSGVQKTLAPVLCGVTLTAAGFFSGRTWPDEPPALEISAVPVAPIVDADAVATVDVPVEQAPGGPFVASASSEKYHPSTGCSYADRIKEENRVYFQTAKEAEMAGYEASSCISKP